MITGTHVWLVTVLIAFYAVLRRSHQLLGREYFAGSVCLACFLCWLGPFAILGALVIKPSEEEQARRSALLAEYQAAEARALRERSRALGID